jgi:hypothetical protein
VKGERTVTQLLSDQPWLIVVALGMLIPITAIVFATVTDYLRKVRQAELEAGLKHEMLQRGMSAEEIRTVIEASGRPKMKTRVCSGRGWHDVHVEPVSDRRGC